MGHGHRITYSGTARAALCVGALVGTALGAWAQGNGSTSRVSLGNGLVEGDGESRNGVLSPDGRYVAFQSLASNLVSVPTSDVYDVFLRDLWTHETTLISAGLGGQGADSSSCCPHWSTDGRWIEFPSGAGNLVLADTNDEIDIFLYDRVTGTITRESVANDGSQADGMSSMGCVSGDGRFVLFASVASNLVANDTNGRGDVFLRDRLTQQTKRVSLGDQGQEGDEDSYFDMGAAISDDGRVVAFTSFASNLVPGDTNGTADCFARDLSTGVLECVSFAAPGVAGDSWGSGGEVSSDGRFVAFESWSSNLLPGDTNDCADVFLRDLQTWALTRMSVSSAGIEGNGVSAWPHLSLDVSRVVFQSEATNFAVGDTNHALDIFVRDLKSGTTMLASRSSAGAISNGRSDVPRISADGRYVTFNSVSTNLVTNDANLVGDVFLHDAFASLPASYCTAKVNSQGCAPAIGSTGSPSLSDPAPFEVRASDVLNQKNGLLLYGFAADASPFLGGWLCVGAPIRRTGVQHSDGNPPPADCSGAFTFDFNAYMQSKGYPEFVPGFDVFTQYWYRDAADPFQSSLTDALNFNPAP